jgi:hypothetical protein
MKRLILFLSIILAAGPSWAAGQEPDPFEAKHSDKDVLFLEYSLTTKVNGDCSVREEEYRKVKVLKEQAERGAGEYEIFYDKDRDKIVEISAHTITPDGKKYPCTSIQDISDLGPDSIYSGLMKKIVIMPKVNVGSIIETRVVKESKPRFRKVYKGGFVLTSSVPTKLLKHTYIFPNNLDIRYKEFNLTHKPKITRDSATITYAWEIRDFFQDSQPEELSPPPTPASISEEAEFSNMKSWDDYSRWYYDLVKKNLKITPEIAAAASQAFLGKATVEEKIRAILEYIQDNFRYVAILLGEHGFEPHPTEEVFKNRYGDCKDLSLLCMAMLKSAGISSNFTLFQEESSGIDPQFSLPGIAKFNHVLLFVDTGNGRGFYIDPQLKNYDLGEYPMSYQQAYTLIIGEDGGRFSRFPVFPEERRHEKQEVDNIIYPDGSILGESYLLRDLDDSIELRNNINSLDNTRKEAMFHRFNQSIAPGGEVIENRQNIGQRYGQVTEYLKIKRPDSYPVSDGFIILEFPGYERRSEFSNEHRKNPIFWETNSFNEYNVTYHFPKGYKILSLPKDYEKTIGFLYIKREYQLYNDQVTVRQISRTKRQLIPKEDYLKIRELFDNLPRDTYQRIILKKE